MQGSRRVQSTCKETMGKAVEERKKKYKDIASALVGQNDLANASPKEREGTNQGAYR